MKKSIIGKTIKSVTNLKRKDSDDSGYLLMEFTDNTDCVIVGAYGCNTGNSVDEYPTEITIMYKNKNNKYNDDYGEIDINNLIPI